MKNRNYNKFPEHMGEVTSIDDERVIGALNAFNACPFNESSKEMKNCAGEDVEDEREAGMAAKIEILNQTLITLGYAERLVWAPDKNGGLSGYNVNTARENRNDLFQNLEQDKYPNAILKKDK